MLWLLFVLFLTNLRRIQAGIFESSVRRRQNRIDNVFITGLPMGKPSRGLRFVCLVFSFSFFSFFFFFFFFVSVKVLPVTPLVSGVFVHRAFCEYFLRIERVVELRRFLWWTQ